MNKKPIVYKRATFEDAEIQPDFIMEDVAEKQAIIAEAAAAAAVTKEDINSMTISLACSIQVQANNFRAVHWNLQATPAFISLHKYLGQAYDRMLDHVDYLSEVIRQDKQIAPHRMSDMLNRSIIKELLTEETTTIDSLAKLVEANESLIGLARNLFLSSSEHPVINNYVAEIIADLRKQNWQLAASIS